MKKLIFSILTSALIITSATAMAANGDIIGHIYSTDIRAFVNGVEVPSYNTGSKTVVVIEDILDSNAYPYFYDDSARTLKFFNLNPEFLIEGKAEYSTTPGNIVGNIYETDIKTSIYDVFVPSYNVGGKMAVAIEDLGYDKEFSPIGGKYIWNEADRTISLEFMYQNSRLISNDKNVTITANEDMTEAEATFSEVLHCGGNSEHFNLPEHIIANPDTEAILPIKAGGEIIGYYFHRPSEEYRFTAFTYYYPEKLREAEKNCTPYPNKTRDDIISHFALNHSGGEPVERFDTEKYSFVYLSLAGTSWTAYNLVQAFDDGTYINYAEEINFPNRSPRNLIIDRENEKVTFQHTDRYHSEWFTNYEIDLKKGTIRPIETEQGNGELNYKIHLTDRKEQTKDCDGKFLIKYTPDNITKSGDAEYFSSSIHSNGNEYEILLQFFNGNHARELIKMFGEISSGNQAVPIHNEEEKYDLINEKLTITVNGETARNVAVKKVSWKGETTVYIYPRDLKPCPANEIKEISICAE